MTCLMVAAENNHDQVVALLLAQPGIQVNARDKMNFTALHWACQMGSVASLTILLAVPVLLLNERNSGGWTPILAAIFYGKTEAVRLMAQVKEVDLDVKDSHNRSLEDIASRYASIPGSGEDIVAVLTETRKRRHLKRQQRIVSKVLLDGLYDRDCPFNMLREPNDVREDVMPIIWDRVWQVSTKNKTTRAQLNVITMASGEVTRPKPFAKSTLVVLSCCICLFIVMFVAYLVFWLIS